MTIRTPDRIVVHGKVVPPSLPDGLITRERLFAELSEDPRVILVSAMPGYGKTVLVRQWIDSIDTPTAWLSLDLLDEDPVSFWSHLLTAIGSVLPGVDEEPAMLLAERGVNDPLFLAALLAELESATDAVVLVLDGLTDYVDRKALEGIAFLVDRSDGRVRVVITTRFDPALPLARWRSIGWLREIRERNLVLTDEEAIAFVHQMDPALGPDDIRDLNRRVDGWPIGLHMALLSREPTATTGFDAGRSGEDSDRLLVDYLVAGVLEAMNDEERDIALSLSILEWFDPEICRQLVGGRGEEVIRRLLGRGMFLTVVDTSAGTMKFHSLFRELMELELSWRNPARRIELHRQAALLWRSRGDMTAAYHHLAMIGSSDTAHELLVGPALELVDRGDHSGLLRFARRLPAIRTVDRADLAFDIAVVALYADGTTAARLWCDWAESLIDEPMPNHREVTASKRKDLQLRLCNRLCAIALLDADLDAALDGVTKHRQLASATPPAQAFDRRFPILAARIMLAAGQTEEAVYWIQRAERIEGPGIITQVCVPTLRAWHEWLFGELDRATRIIDSALGWIEQNRIGTHHLAFETLITAGWCRLSAGDLVDAKRLARSAREDADALGYAWNQLQAGYLSAQVELFTGNPGMTLQIIEDLRSRVAFDSCRPFADRILGMEIEALVANGSPIDPMSMLDDLGPGPRTQLLRARFARHGDAQLVELLADRATWPTQLRLQAELLLSANDGASERPDDLIKVVSQCAQTGWVSPFLGLGTNIERRLQALPLEQLHPQLARSLTAAPVQQHPSHISAGEVRLTSRELTLLELLPTHLSYAEMGERLYLSVNTVKSNLKSLYRKLDARTRSEAVEAGRVAALL